MFRYLSHLLRILVVFSFVQPVPAPNFKFFSSGKDTQSLDKFKGIPYVLDKVAKAAKFPGKIDIDKSEIVEPFSGKEVVKKLSEVEYKVKAGLQNERVTGYFLETQIDKRFEFSLLTCTLELITAQEVDRIKRFTSTFTTDVNAHYQKIIQDYFANMAGSQEFEITVLHATMCTYAIVMFICGITYTAKEFELNNRYFSIFILQKPSLTPKIFDEEVLHIGVYKSTVAEAMNERNEAILKFADWELTAKDITERTFKLVSNPTGFQDVCPIENQIEMLKNVRENIQLYFGSIDCQGATLDITILYMHSRNKLELFYICQFKCGTTILYFMVKQWKDDQTWTYALTEMTSEVFDLISFSKAFCHGTMPKSQAQIKSKFELRRKVQLSERESASV